MTYSDDLVATLLRHDIGERAARRVVTVGTHLWQQSSRRSVEFAAMLDVETGDPVAPAVEGDADRADIRSHLAAMLPQRRYLQLHTHPGGGPPTPQDIAVLAYEPQIVTLTVVAGRDAWYMLSAPASARQGDPRSVLTAYAKALAALSPKYLALVRSRSLSRKRASVEGRHEATQHIAVQFGLRYDRVQRSASS